MRGAPPTRAEKKQQSQTNLHGLGVCYGSNKPQNNGKSYHADCVSTILYFGTNAGSRTSKSTSIR